MKRFLILLAIAVISQCSIAARYDYTFKNTPIADALTMLIKDHPEARITFIYNEMDDYKTSAVVSTDNLKAAVKAIVARNPISVSEKKGHILVEALQRGKYRYTGKLVNEFSDPVDYATVILLNPKDSVALTYGITERDGGFLIPCDRKPVLAKISSTGYETTIMKFSSPSMGTIHINTKTIELENVEILSETVHMEPDKTVFIPLQRQKNAATDAIDLLEHMGIPQIRIIDNTVETFSGKPVSFFINHLPSSRDDLSNMNLQDVRRVEYLESPSDPRFMGEKNVINFIMDRYLYGGYVKLNGYKSLNFDDQYVSANARYQYKCMTYDIAGYGQYFDISHAGTETTETFRFPQSDGTMRSIVRESTLSDSKTSGSIGRLSFKATYNSSDITARTIISGGITDRPSHLQEGEVSYTPEEYPNTVFTSKLKNNVKYLRLNGSYIFNLPEKITMTFSPSYTLSHTDEESRYDEATFAPVVNGADDHTSNLYGFLNVSRNFGKGGSLTAYTSGRYDYYRTRYSGSSVNFDKSKNQRYRAGIYYSLTAGDFYGSADFGWIWDIDRFNDFRSRTSSPLAELSLSYLLDKKHRFNVSCKYNSWAPEVSFKSETVIAVNQLMSYTGNPMLKPSRNMRADLSYNWIPSKNGYIQAFAGIWKVLNRFVYEYEPVGDKMIRYIRQPLGEYHIVHYGISGRLYLLNRSLMLSGSLTGTVARNGAPYDYTLSDLRYSLRASYWLRDFYFSGSYSSASNYSDGFMVGDIYEDKSTYYLSAGWANKNWNLRFDALNFARWNWISNTQRFTSEYYDRTFKTLSRGRHADFNITVIYTFNYGKKLRDVDELGTNNSSSSGILRN